MSSFNFTGPTSTGITASKCTISAGGRKYNFVVELFKDNDFSQNNGYVLDNSSISEFMMLNSINKLYMTASLDYADSTGIIANLIDRSKLNCFVMMSGQHQEFDGQSTLEISEYKSSETMFLHDFIVTQVEILRREGSTIFYKLHMVSSKWQNCIATLSYSNWARPNPTPILEILQECMKKVNLQTDASSFNTLAPKSPSIEYATPPNSTIQTAFEYLMRRSVYEPDNKLDESLKVLWYDQIEDTYKLTDLKDGNTYDRHKFAIAISMFKGNEEGLTNEYQVDIATPVDYLPKTITYQTVFDTILYQHDVNDSNKLIQNTLSSNVIANYFSASWATDGVNDKTSLTTNVQPILSVFPENIQPQGQENKFMYRRLGSYDNNEVNIYYEQINCLMRSHSIILLVDGRLNRKLTSLFTISIPKQWQDANTEDVQKYKDWVSRYMSLEGDYIITSILTIISPANQTYRQNLTLSRNFGSTPI